MQREQAEQVIADAVKTLMRHERGREAMIGLHEFLNMSKTPCGLDMFGKDAVLTLMYNALGDFPGTVLCILADTVADIRKGKVG